MYGHGCNFADFSDYRRSELVAGRSVQVRSGGFSVQRIRVLIIQNHLCIGGSGRYLDHYDSFPSQASSQRGLSIEKEVVCTASFFAALGLSKEIFKTIILG